MTQSPLTLLLAGGLLAMVATASALAASSSQQKNRRVGPKRLVICMDGTWNNPARPAERDDGDQVFKPTNVLKACRAVKDIDDTTATLVFTGQPKDDETVTIDGKIYTFQDRLTDGDGHVQIGEDAKKSLENLRFAINTESGRKRYSEDTSRHPTVEAREVKGAPLSFELTTQPNVPKGDPFAVSTTLTHGSWIDKREIAAQYRDRDADPVLGIPQIVFYDVGVGALRMFPGFSNGVHRTIDRLFGGAAGAGFEGNVEDAYTFLAHNYAPGDEIFIFGFSRGASTARGLSRFIEWMGGIPPSKDAYWIPRCFDAFLTGASFEDTRQAIFHHHLKKLLKEIAKKDLDDKARTKAIKKAHEKAHRIVGSVQPARVKFLGVWDTVLAIGKKRARPHIGEAPAAIVDHARQALAIDERRADFRPRLWQRTAADNPEQTLEQRWFAGVHSNVGGGYVHDGLANLALKWMLEEARSAGLGLDWEFLWNYGPYPQDQLYDSSTLFWRIAQTVTFRNKKGIRKLRTSEDAGLTFHPSVFQRLASPKAEPDDETRSKLKQPYRPNNLLRFLAGVPDLDAFLATIPGLREDFTLPNDVKQAIRHAR